VHRVPLLVWPLLTVGSLSPQSQLGGWTAQLTPAWPVWTFSHCHGVWCRKWILRGLHCYEIAPISGRHAPLGEGAGILYPRSALSCSVVVLMLAWTHGRAANWRVLRCLVTKWPGHTMCCAFAWPVGCAHKRRATLLWLWSAVIWLAATAADAIFSVRGWLRLGSR